MSTFKPGDIVTGTNLDQALFGKETKVVEVVRDGEYKLCGNRSIWYDSELRLVRHGDGALRAGDYVSEELVSRCTPVSSGEHPEYAKGSLYVVVNPNHGLFRRVVELKENDDTYNPYFSTDDETHVIRWSALAALPKDYKETPNMGTSETVVENVSVTFSDGVKISTDTVEFDGRQWGRKELRETIKRYTEVLNRPLPSVPKPGDKVRAPRKTAKKAVKPAKKSK